MGAYLSQPVTAKSSADGADDTFAYGTTAMQGWRTNMEDAHSTILNLDDTNTSFFAVFDGHGGKEVALYAAKHLHEALKREDAYKGGDMSAALQASFLRLDEMMLAKDSAAELTAFRNDGQKSDEPSIAGLLGGEGSSAEDKKSRRAEVNAKLRAALIEQVKEANPDIDEDDIKFDFELDDDDFDEIAPSSSGSDAMNIDKAHEHWTGPQAGATSVVVVVRGDKVYCANAGDSRAVFCRKDGKAVDMSIDHKPMNDAERARIMKAGGFVSEGRVNGSLALSRALGDFEYKQNQNLTVEEQAVTALPEIKEFTIEQGDEFFILACDGIWDVLSSQECVDFVRERLKAGEEKLSKVCEELCDRCLAPDTRGSGLGCDNMSVIICVLKNKPSGMTGHVTTMMTTTMMTTTTTIIV